MIKVWLDTRLTRVALQDRARQAAHPYRGLMFTELNEVFN